MNLKSTHFTSVVRGLVYDRCVFYRHGLVFDRRASSHRCGLVFDRRASTYHRGLVFDRCASSHRRGLVYDCRTSSHRRGLVYDFYAIHRRGLAIDRYTPPSLAAWSMIPLVYCQVQARH
jgi:hypothetical protein